MILCDSSTPSFSPQNPSEPPPSTNTNPLASPRNRDIATSVPTTARPKDKITPPESLEEFLQNMGLPYLEDEPREQEKAESPPKNENWSKEISELNVELYFRIHFFSVADEHTVEMVQVGYLPFNQVEEDQEYVLLFVLTNSAIDKLSLF